MTGANTDAVSMPAFEQASSLLIKLARPCFDVWMSAASTDPMSPHCNAWFALRRVAEIMSAQQSTRLKRADFEMMIRALKVAHELAHDNDPQGDSPIEICHCAVSEDIRDLAGLVGAR